MIIAKILSVPPEEFRGESAEQLIGGQNLRRTRP